MKIRKDDMVIVVSGKDKGKKGKVARAFPASDRVIVEGINLKKHHERARKSGQKGQVIDKAAPLHVSNVMLIDPKSGKGTRVGVKREEGKRARVAKKSKSEI
jgi:large subunit ribosomal protein L24